MCFLGSDTSVGGPCPISHYCPSGTSSPYACEAGTYNNITQQDTCFTCHAGYYCPDNTTFYQDYPCPPGHYCPSGTNSSTQYPCPLGTYRPDEYGTQVSDCLPCPCGKYCGNIGLSAPTGDCNQGNSNRIQF